MASLETSALHLSALPRAAVEWEGRRYFIDNGIDGHGDLHDVFCCDDGRHIGRLRGSPSQMWLLEADAAEADLLRAIALVAIEEGVIGDLASD